MPIRAVYQMNCYGQTFNETWLSLGAKVTCGARYVNFYPNQFNKFASEWKKGDVDFAEALRELEHRVIVYRNARIDSC